MPINESMHFSVCLYVCLCFGGLYFTHYNLHEMHFYVFAYHWNTAFVCLFWFLCFVFHSLYVILYIFIFYEYQRVYYVFVSYFEKRDSSQILIHCLSLKHTPGTFLNILSIILIRIVLIDFWFAIFILINCT